MTEARGLCVLVLGYVVRGPLGGLAWHHVQYLLGLRALGHDAYFLEDSDDYPACYDPSRDVMDTDAGYGLRFATRVFARLGLGERWAYHDAHRQRWEGPLAGSVHEVCERADVVLNVSGVNPLRPWWTGVPRRVLVDTDPVFTQVRHLRDAEALDRARRHTDFFTFGENLGEAGCSIPDDGLPWRPTRQPVALDAWPVLSASRAAPFTTVMQWDSYREAEHQGRRFGMKSASFAPYLDLPRRVHERFELAVGSPSAPLDLLREHGWSVRNPLEPTRDPWTYQAYLQASKAEFSVAKQGYVSTASGWFSERSAAYLASGRPVVVQETGFSRWLPTGAGVLAFGSLGEAVAAVESVERDYERHCAAARACVAEHFDARRVLPPLLGPLPGATGSGACDSCAGR